MDPIDYLAIGHVTVDMAPDGERRLGGAVSYAALTATALGLRAGIVTRCAPGVPDAVALAGVTCQIRPAPVTTTFRNQYDAAGNRHQVLLDLAPAVDADDVPAVWRRARIVHLAPIAHEVGPVFASLVGAASFVGLSPQGWLRELAPGDLVRPGPWRVPPALVARADAIVVSAEDLAGEPRGIGWLVPQVPVLVVTRGREGAVAYANGAEVRQSAVPAEAVDPTGAGDVFAAAFFVRYDETKDVTTALRFAAGAAALAIEGQGVRGIASRAAIEARLAAA
jgi:1D-myo-inositol 3-kinase